MANHLHRNLQSMQRDHLDALVAFVAVGPERSFTKAAAKLGVSHSKLQALGVRFRSEPV
jgi:regulatory helix-turn-helix LysR family protein